ncbi:DUF1453 domain-containing protein [Streptomyces sp. NBC_01190]|uniref:DUF1453 domain-containing protein n=1 Tax=Streptomyces sp. NBC_01190 TaxID=2903767 RepID=UPI00386FAC0A|nr:DUF1453 domain-containing protein [Streptomyces sp. NBC_01190]
MPGLVNSLLIAAVIGVVIARQLRPRRVDGGRWWLIPGVLIVLAVRGGGLIDPHHREVAAVLLTAELLVGAVLGVVWASTARIWTESDGSVWSRGTRATITVWVLGIAFRIGLYAIAAADGVHQDSDSILLAVAVTLLIRSGTLLHRAQALRPSYRSVS